MDDFFDQVDPARIAVVRYERERIDAWIWNRLIAYPLGVAFVVAGLSSRAGPPRQEGRTPPRSRPERDFISSRVTPSGGVSRKPRRGGRWGLAWRDDRSACAPRGAASPCRTIIVVREAAIEQFEKDAGGP